MTELIKFDKKSIIGLFDKDNDENNFVENNVGSTLDMGNGL